MSAHSITQKAVAEVIERDQSYVSERVSGKRPFTVDDIDAIANMIGVDGRTLLLKIAKLLPSDRSTMADRASTDELSEVPSISEGGDFAVAANQRHDAHDERRLLTEND